MGLVCERLQHQRKSVHVEVPHVFRRHLLPACNFLGLVTFTIHTKITAFSVTAKGFKMYKKSAKMTRMHHE